MHKPLPALLVALFLSATAGAQSFDELLPDSTVFYASVENAARTRERFETSPLRALWKDETVQRFLEGPLKRWSDWLEKSKAEQGVSFDEVLSVVEGQVAFGVGGSPDELEVMMLADIGRNEEKLRDILKRAEQSELEKEGYAREEEEFRGTTIVTYAREEDEEREADRYSWCIAGELFAVSDDLEQLKRVLVRKEDGGEDALPGREVYQAMRARLGGRADFVFYVDGENLVKMIKDGEEGEEGDDSETWRILGALGLTAIEGIGGQLSLGEESVDLQVFMPVRGKKEGLLKLFDGKNSALVPPSFIPPDADSAGVLAFDVNALWQELRLVLDRVEEGTTAEMDASLEGLKQQTGVDVQKDIIAALGEELVFYMKFPDKPAGAAAPAPGMFNPFAAIPAVVLALQVKDRPRLETALNNLLAQAGPMVAPQDYLGVKMHVVNTPLGVTPALALLPDRFVFGLRTEDVKEVIGRYGKDVKGLLDEERYARALSDVPPERMSISVTNEARALGQSFFAGFFAGLATVQGGNAGGDDLNRLPSAETIEKYLGVSVAWIVNEEDGISWTYRLHLKKQEQEEGEEE